MTPHGLAGEDIPLIARVVAVADVYDALVSSRPYKHAWSTEDALAYIKQQAGKQLDPKCVAAFFSRIDIIQQIHTEYSDDDFAQE